MAFRGPAFGVQPQGNRAEKIGHSKLLGLLLDNPSPKSFPMLGNRTVFSFVLTAGLIVASRVFEVPSPPSYLWWGVRPIPGPEA